MVALGAALAAKCRRVLFLWQRLNCGCWTTWALCRDHAGTTRTLFVLGVGAPSGRGCRQVPSFRAAGPGQPPALRWALLGGHLPWGSPPGSPPSPGCAVGPGLQCWWKQRPPNWFGPFQTLPLSLSGFKGLLLRPTHPNTLPANPRGSPPAPKSLPPQLCLPSAGSFRQPQTLRAAPMGAGGSEDAVGGTCWTVAVGAVGPMGFLSITEVAETRLRCPGQGSRTPGPPTALQPC